MRVGVANIDGQRIPPLLLEDGSETMFNLGKRLIPTGRVPLVASVYHRCTNAIRIGLQFLKAIGLRAKIALTEYILLIALNGDHFLPLCGNLQPAGSFAEWTGDIARPCSHQLKSSF